MKTLFGVDYHRRFSFGTIMNEGGEILKQADSGTTPSRLLAFSGSTA